MKAAEIRELTKKEIQERLDAVKEELTKMRINHSISPLDNPSEIKNSRRLIAKLNTELRTRQLNEVK